MNRVGKGLTHCNSHRKTGKPLGMSGVLGLDLSIQVHMWHKSTVNVILNAA